MRINSQKHFRFLLLAAVAGVTACAGVPVEEQSDELRLLLGEIKAREQVLDKRQSVLDKRGTLLATLELQQEAAAQQSPLRPEADSASLKAAFLPAPIANVQQCFRLTRLPPRLSAEPQDVIVQDAADRIEVIPPVFFSETVEKVVDYERLDSSAEMPPMQERTESFELRQAYASWAPIDAKFVSQTEAMLASPSHQDFKVCGAAPLAEGMTAQWCATTVAAQYQNIERATVQELSDVKPIMVPAENIDVVVRTPVNPADLVKLRPVTRQLVHERVSQPASYRRVVRLPEFKTVTMRQLTRPAALMWREVVCAEVDRPPLLKAIQQALNLRGYDVGEPDGAWGDKTAKAIAQFREDKMMPDLGEDIGIDLLNKLEVSLP